MTQTLAFGTHPHHYLERSGSVHKERKAARVRQVFEVLEWYWLTPEAIAERLEEEGLRLTANTIKDYIRKNDFAKLNLEVNIDGWNIQRSQPSLETALALAKEQLGEAAHDAIAKGSPESVDGYLEFWIQGQPFAWGIDTDPVLLQNTESSEEFADFAGLLSSLEPKEVDFNEFADFYKENIEWATDACQKHFQGSHWQDLARQWGETDDQGVCKQFYYFFSKLGYHLSRKANSQNTDPKIQ